MNNQEYPQISVITPNLNNGKYIENTILSVLNQNYPNLEYIVVDGGSTDNSLDIIDKYSKNIICINEKDNGQSEAINKGIKIASGDVLCYLNSDDILLPNSLFNIAEIFLRSPNVYWVTGYCRIINDVSHEVRKFITIYKQILLNIRSLKLLYITDFISQPSTFWRKKIVDEIGLFNVKYHFAMDYDYFIRLWQKQKPFIIRKYLAGFRIHENSKSTIVKNFENYIKEEQEIIRYHSNSKLWLLLHDIHRNIMTEIYYKINK